MKIGIVGGTGDIGEGMSRRLSSRYDVILGSREADKAHTTSECTIDLLKQRGFKSSCTGVSNQEAVSAADVIILAVPFKHLESTISGLSGFEGKIVVSPVNPMEKKDFFTIVPPPEGSAALLVNKLLPGARVVTAFNTIAANRWKDLDAEIDVAVPVCSDDADAKLVIMGIVNGTSMLKAYDAGPLAVSAMIESLTPLLLNIARYNKMHDVGIKFV
ncbi:MAG: NADPH-dependent F420 reductase [Methanomicrobiales archaeon]|nr:NADPH-dependent F420 reductase [Methanomicrobiales archaeon]